MISSIAERGAPVEQLVDLVGTAPVARTGVAQSLARRPAAVAVENHGQVPRRGGRLHLAPQPARVERVRRARERQRHAATAPADRRIWQRHAPAPSSIAPVMAESARLDHARPLPEVRRQRTSVRGDVSPASDDHDARPTGSAGARPCPRGGLAAAALGAASLPAEAADAGDQERRSPACLSPEMTEGPYYLPGEKVRRNITEGLPGAPLALRLSVARRHELQADQGRRRRHLARERRRQVLRRGGQRHRRPHVPARHPAHRREGARALQDGLPRLVPGPRRAHPREGARRRRRRAHGPAVLPRQLHGRRLQARALPRTRHARRAQHRRLHLRQTAAAARC